MYKRQGGAGARAQRVATARGTGSVVSRSLAIGRSGGVAISSRRVAVARRKARAVYGWRLERLERPDGARDGYVARFATPDGPRVVRV